MPYGEFPVTLAYEDWLPSWVISFGMWQWNTELQGITGWDGLWIGLTIWMSDWDEELYGIIGSDGVWIGLSIRMCEWEPDLNGITGSRDFPQVDPQFWFTANE